ncbi:MAG TPA: DUF1553 domain-containing protein [Verrucomicrobiales bacterium]|nr:DUF1553 domain-containing protein [Verrucomicrobiales bacterium]
MKSRAPSRHSARFLVQIGRLLGVAASVWAWTIATETAAGEGSDGTSAALEGFEQRIRPVLVDECYECHRSNGKRKGGLAVDYRDGLLEGGESGPALVPGDAEASLLIRALRHTAGELKMPHGRPRLDEGALADFAGWVNSGAYDPRDAPAPSGTVETGKDWVSVREERRKWWSFQPLTHKEPPETAGERHPVDAFIAARLMTEGLHTAGPAEPATLARRAAFVLTGLPPSAAQLQAFLEDTQPGAYARYVDALLASPHYGERWARHWMDWFRYAESHGSEGDPAIPHAWRYRDYLIRALNADVPYDQLVREQLAGDLLPAPRIDLERGVNESAAGPAHLRMVFHGFAPTDALDEQVRFVDNQIDVVSKALLGLTVSCARCHDHKFDPVSQRDFYAWYGIFASCRPALRTVNLPETRAQIVELLQTLKDGLREQLAEAWLESAAVWEMGQGPALSGGSGEEEDPASETLLKPWRDLRSATEAESEGTWKALRDRWLKNLRDWRQWRERPGVIHWPATSDDAAWFPHGTGVEHGPVPAGAFAVRLEGDRILDDVLPAGWYSHLVSPRDSGIVHSRGLLLEDGRELYLRAMGAGGAVARYAVQNYPRDGTVYPVSRLNGGSWAWQHWDLRYWTGDRIHTEISTALDQPVLSRTEGPPSWFGLREVIAVPAGSGGPPAEDLSAWSPLFELAALSTVSAKVNVNALFGHTVRRIAQSWRSGDLDDAGASFLGMLVRSGDLPAQTGDAPGSEALLREYRRLERRLPEPVRVPGVVETEFADQPLFERGNHRRPLETVPRGFLEVFSSEAYPAGSSGRLELAEDILAPDNPLAARVIVNRLWHHVFGKGIVATTDNFGRLGREPTHPELLDYLACRFADDGWSIRSMLRILVLSDAFSASSQPPPGAAEKDPGNALWSYFPVRRLEAEAIRDAILATAGTLDPALFGPPVSGESGRRSIYLRVMRNDLDPLLAVFDAPEPHTTRGSRDATNVPAQSLALLNDPFVIRLAKEWADRVSTGDGQASTEKRIAGMFRQALGREPRAGEIQGAVDYLEASRQARERAAATLAETQKREASLQAQLGELRETVRRRATAAGDRSPEAPAAPDALWEWDFSASNVDTEGAAAPRLTLHGGARQENGALALDGTTAWASAGPLTRPLKAKTLEAWVIPANLEQRGGGIIGVQTHGGGIFDSIVFGEREPRRWLAGSNFFERTRDFGGPAENGSAGESIHIAVVWDGDGTIAGYRGGEPYGKAYRSGGPAHFPPETAEIVLGMRHSPAAPGKLFAGRILRARVFDRALSPEEVAASADGGKSWSGQRLAAAMTQDERLRSENLEQELTICRAEGERMRRELGEDTGPGGEWRDLAQSLFNLKEFIYLH